MERWLQSKGGHRRRGQAFCEQQRSTRVVRKPRNPSLLSIHSLLRPFGIDRYIETIESVHSIQARTNRIVPDYSVDFRDLRSRRELALDIEPVPQQGLVRIGEPFYAKRTVQGTDYSIRTYPHCEVSQNLALPVVLITLE